MPKRKKKKPKKRDGGGLVQIRVALAWYRPEQWNRLREVSADRDALEDTFLEWVTGAEETAQEMRNLGMIVKKVEIDVDELVEWCRKEKRPVDSAARSSLAVEKMRGRQSGEDNASSEGL